MIRDTFVVFYIPNEHVRSIRKLVHSQDWYNGVDMVIKEGEKVNKSGIVTGRISGELSRFFLYLSQLSAEYGRNK